MEARPWGGGQEAEGELGMGVGLDGGCQHHPDEALAGAGQQLVWAGGPSTGVGGWGAGGVGMGDMQRVGDP